MMDRESDRIFSGDVPALYERLLVPLIFEPYARDMARRLGELASGNVLEVAAGTGVVTRALATALPTAVALTASDLSQAMIDRAVRVGTDRPVRWEQADVLSLPFGNASFDAVVCQFGVMFFPVKADAFAEVHRVLRPGGRFLFNVWQRIENNEFADVVTQAVSSLFPTDPPLFLRRTPHGYHDPEIILDDLRAGGFHSRARIEPLDSQSRATTAQAIATAYCQGTPLRDDIERRAPGRLAEATSVAADALAQRFGPADLVGRISALVITAIK